ncbi:putative F-box domain, leucine-rich repeat domain, L domain-containing protein [Medicago truncatula]|uniref:Putative F-box domain, leucine-rich repeat domain, L domain-containing protein n=1 Tax=Medicago truncatula TaxID=3880 RepID=A0A396J2L7_MEDTR|nr:putative F-box domain, leucine-rich repeat domain, L domain-containing protein [Medicago truncatula]
MESLSSSSSSVTSSPNSKQVTDSGERNWVDLPRDSVLSIFRKLDSIDILIRPYNVCTIWREISKDHSLYRTINMPNSADPNTKWELLNLCYRAVDYSFGHIIHINIENFATDALLHHITNSYNLTHHSFEAIGRSCPRLKTFKFNIQAYKYPRVEDDDDAFAIAQTMPGLRHLQLFGNKMTNDGLLAILDGCLHLESLDIRQCFNINFNLVASVGKRFIEQVKYLRLPYDATDDYPFQAAFDYASLAEDPDWFVYQDFLSDDDYEYYEVL